MLAGLLTETISLYRPVKREDKFGKSTKIDYIPYIEKTRARVIDNKGTRTNENNEIIYVFNVTFVIRGYHKIDNYMRIKWKNNFYKIINISPATSHINEIQIEAQIINE